VRFVLALGVAEVAVLIVEVPAVVVAVAAGP
jgi:hypothetical protein